MGDIYAKRAEDPALRFPPKRAFTIVRIQEGSATVEEKDDGTTEYTWSEDIRAERVGTFLDLNAAADNFELITSREQGYALFAPNGATLGCSQKES